MQFSPSRLHFRAQFCDRNLHYFPVNPFWPDPHLRSSFFRAPWRGRAAFQLAVSLPAQHNSSFPTEGAGGWLCLGWVLLKDSFCYQSRTGLLTAAGLCTYWYTHTHVQSAITQGPPQLPVSHCDSEEVRLFETIGTVTWKQLNLSVFYQHHSWSHIREWMRKILQHAIPQHWQYQFNSICWLH